MPFQRKKPIKWKLTAKSQRKWLKCRFLYFQLDEVGTMKTYGTLLVSIFINIFQKDFMTSLTFVIMFEVEFDIFGRTIVVLIVFEEFILVIISPEAKTTIPKGFPKSQNYSAAHRSK